MNQGVAGSSPAGTTEAGVVKLVTTPGLSPGGQKCLYGFDSRLRHEEKYPRRPPNDVKQQMWVKL